MSRLRRLSTSIGVLLLAAPLVSALAAQTVVRDTMERTVATIANSVPIVSPMAMPRAVAIRAAAPALIVPAGVTQAKDAVGSHSTADAVAPNATDYSSGGARSSTMIVVGGAAFITGVIVGGNAGTAVMIGGGILALVGLWNYLR
ncbi:MAG TPA: hypothetical protein VFS57_00270 [Gemmatimonadaceae bacterium]|nr:hypothetical protein [Gemmatimonadaceae bacterium]